MEPGSFQAYLFPALTIFMPQWALKGKMHFTNSSPLSIKMYPTVSDISQLQLLPPLVQHIVKSSYVWHLDLTECVRVVSLRYVPN